MAGVAENDGIGRETGQKTKETFEDCGRSDRGGL